MSRHLSTTGPSTVTTSNTRRTRDMSKQEEYSRVFTNYVRMHICTDIYTYIYTRCAVNPSTLWAVEPYNSALSLAEFGSSLDQYRHSLYSASPKFIYLNIPLNYCKQIFIKEINMLSMFYAPQIHPLNFNTELKKKLIL